MLLVIDIYIQLIQNDVIHCSDLKETHYKKLWQQIQKSGSPLKITKNNSLPTATFKRKKTFNKDLSQQSSLATQQAAHIQCIALIKYPDNFKIKRYNERL